MKGCHGTTPTPAQASTAIAIVQPWTRTHPRTESKPHHSFRATVRDTQAEGDKQTCQGTPTRDTTEWVPRGQHSSSVQGIGGKRGHATSQGMPPEWPLPRLPSGCGSEHGRLPAPPSPAPCEHKSASHPNGVQASGVLTDRAGWKGNVAAGRSEPGGPAQRAVGSPWE